MKIDDTHVADLWESSIINLQIKPKSFLLEFLRLVLPAVCCNALHLFPNIITDKLHRSKGHLQFMQCISTRIGRIFAGLGAPSVGFFLCASFAFGLIYNKGTKNTKLIFFVLFVVLTEGEIMLEFISDKALF